MRSFHINPPGYQEPEPEPHWYNIGTRIIFAVNQFTESPAEPISLSFA